MPDAPLKPKILIVDDQPENISLLVPVELPPLRQRKEDIPLLVDHFLKQYPEGQRPPVTGNLLQALMNHDWPGNVRELRTPLQRFVTLKKLDFMGVDLGEEPRTKDLEKAFH